jgi:predicted HTH transcriptional regulator
MALADVQEYLKLLPVVKKTPQGSLWSSYDAEADVLYINVPQSYVDESKAIAWLNQFAGQVLEARQQLALVYLRHNEQMTNSDYRRLNHVDSVTANRELRGLVQAELIEQSGTRRWAYNTLSIPSEASIFSPPQSDEEKVLAYVRERGFIKRADCQRLLDISAVQARYLLQKMKEKGLLQLQGSRKGAQYVSSSL